MRVAHEDFGVGIIQYIEGSNSFAKVKVLFEGNVLKNLKVQYAHLTILSD